MSPENLLHLSAQIMQAKNHDYSGAQGDPLSNFRLSVKLGIPASQGVALRMLDKHQRIRTFIAKGFLAVKQEGIQDAILDCVNYTILYEALLHGVQTSEELYHCRAELESHVKVAYQSYPTDPRILLDNLEGELCRTCDVDTEYLLGGYLKLGGLLIQ